MDTVGALQPSFDPAFAVAVALTSVAAVLFVILVAAGQEIQVTGTMVLAK